MRDSFDRSPLGAFIRSPLGARGTSTRELEREGSHSLQLVSVGLVLTYGYRNAQSAFGTGWLNSGSIDCGTKTEFFPTALNNILDAAYLANGWRRAAFGFPGSSAAVPIGWAGMDCDSPGSVQDSDTLYSHPGWNTPTPHPVSFMSDYGVFGPPPLRSTPRTGWPGGDPVYYGIFGRNWTKPYINNRTFQIDNDPFGYQAGTSTITIKNVVGSLGNLTYRIGNRYYRGNPGFQVSLGSGRYSVPLMTPLQEGVAHEADVHDYSHSAIDDTTDPTNCFEPNLIRSGGYSASTDATGLTLTLAGRAGGPANGYNNFNDGVQEPGKLTPPGVVLFVPEPNRSGTLALLPGYTSSPLCAFEIPGSLPGFPPFAIGYRNHQIIGLDVIPTFTLRFERV
jgi:hypothetical protein